MRVADTRLFQGFPGVEGAEWTSCTAEVAALWKLISGSVLLPHGGITSASRNLLTSPASRSFLAKQCARKRAMVLQDYFL